MMRRRRIDTIGRGGTVLVSNRTDVVPDPVRLLSLTVAEGPAHTDDGAVKRLDDIVARSSDA